MANKSFFETVTQYRLKIEKDGKDVMNVPGIFALPGLLAMPKLSIAGLIAAPLLGLKVQLENENGDTVKVEEAALKAADAVKKSVTSVTKTVQEEIDKAWEAVSADDPEGSAEEGAAEEAEENAAENTETHEAGDASIEEIEADLKAQEDDDIPTIEVKSDNSARA